MRENGSARIGDRQDVLVNSRGNWGGTVTPGFVERFEKAYDRVWQAFRLALRRVGYDDVLSIEHEDVLMNSVEGVTIRRPAAPRRPA